MYKKIPKIIFFSYFVTWFFFFCWPVCCDESINWSFSRFDSWQEMSTVCFLTILAPIFANILGESCKQWYAVYRNRIVDKAKARRKRMQKVSSFFFCFCSLWVTVEHVFAIFSKSLFGFVENLTSLWDGYLLSSLAAFEYFSSHSFVSCLRYFLLKLPHIL